MCAKVFAQAQLGVWSKGGFIRSHYDSCRMKLLLYPNLLRNVCQSHRPQPPAISSGKLIHAFLQCISLYCVLHRVFFSRLQVLHPLILYCMMLGLVNQWVIHAFLPCISLYCIAGRIFISTSSSPPIITILYYTWPRQPMDGAMNESVDVRQAKPLCRALFQKKFSPTLHC